MQRDVNLYLYKGIYTFNTLLDAQNKIPNFQIKNMLPSPVKISIQYAGLPEFYMTISSNDL